MQNWPRIRARCRPFVRADASIQFGLDPDTGIRLTGLTDAETAWIQSLDGSHDPLPTGIAAGLTSSRLTAILTALEHAGVLTDTAVTRAPGRSQFNGLDFEHEWAAGAPATHHARAYAAVLDRGSAHVWIDGQGPLAAGLADVLRQAGVGDVTRLPNASRLLGTRRRPALVILVRGAPMAPTQVHPWQGRGISHLPVVLTDTGATIGPVVRPGQTPCLRCIDLVRADLDPSWTLLRAQLETEAGLPEPPVGGESALSTIGAGLAARVALAAIDALPVAAGLALDVTTPWPTMRQRRWPAHPECGCGAPAPSAGLTMDG